MKEETQKEETSGMGDQELPTITTTTVKTIVHGSVTEIIARLDTQNGILRAENARLLEENAHLLEMLHGRSVATP